MTAVDIIKDQLKIISEKSPGEMETVLKLVRLAAEKVKPGLSEKQRVAKAREFINNGGLKSFKQFQ